MTVSYIKILLVIVPEELKNQYRVRKRKVFKLILTTYVNKRNTLRCIFKPPKPEDYILAFIRPISISVFKY